MTTRRLRLPGPLPPRGRSGRFGLPPLAICLLVSVKTCERGIDPDALSQCPREPPLCQSPLEAGEVTTGVRPAPWSFGAGNEHTVPGGEALQVALRRAPATADAATQRLAHLCLVRDCLLDGDAPGNLRRLRDLGHRLLGLGLGPALELGVGLDELVGRRGHGGRVVLTGLRSLLV